MPQICKRSDLPFGELVLSRDLDFGIWDFSLCLGVLVVISTLFGKELFGL